MLPGAGSAGIVYIMDYRRPARSRYPGGGSWGAIMPSGTVVFFSAAKGYGFISPDAGGQDCFVHLTAVQAARLPELTKGQRLRFEVQVARNGKQSAVNLAAITE